MDEFLKLFEDEISKSSTDTHAKEKTLSQRPGTQMKRPAPSESEMFVVPSTTPCLASLKKIDVEQPMDKDVELVPNAMPLMTTVERRASLKNKANTCYLNALLHAISCVPAVANWISHHRHEDENIAPCTLCDLRSDVQHLRFGAEGSCIEPRIAKNRATWSQGQFAGRSQQDAHEAYGILGNRILALENQSNNHAFQNIMCGQERSNRVCNHCHRQYTTDLEVWLGLTLHFKHRATLTRTYTLEEMLTSYISPVPVDDWKCEDCCMTGCTQELTIHRWPQVLCLLLKRFYADRNTLTKKRDDKVVFTEFLDEFDNRPRYQLRSVCIHSGISFKGGHYTSYVRANTGGWFFCDDHATPVSTTIEHVLSCQAYILFYERID